MSECGAVFGYHREHTCIIPPEDHTWFHECECGEDEFNEQS